VTPGEILPLWAGICYQKKRRRPFPVTAFVIKSKAPIPFISLRLPLRGAEDKPRDGLQILASKAGV